ncbi:MAG: hypothetical protein ABH873_05180 [Candidatus Firestonebacteria bacterium]
MGSKMNYAKGRQAMRRMSDGKKKAFAQNIIIKDGRGRYPKCFEILPYQWCPKKEEIPEDPKNVPETCKLCQEFVKSKFFNEHFAKQTQIERLKHMKESGLPVTIETTIEKKDDKWDEDE